MLSNAVSVDNEIPTNLKVAISVFYPVAFPESSSTTTKSCTCGKWRGKGIRLKVAEPRTATTGSANAELSVHKTLQRLIPIRNGMTAFRKILIQYQSLTATAHAIEASESQRQHQKNSNHNLRYMQCNCQANKVVRYHVDLVLQ
jgi:hypothetical protein